MTGRENLEMVARLFGHGKRRGAPPRPTRCCERARPGDAGRPPGADLLGRHAPPARPRRQPRRRARGCCCSTSRPPVSTRAAGSSCGRPIRDLVADGTDVLLTTQYLEEADQLADHIVIIDHGRVDRRRARPPSSRREAGRDVIEVRVRARRRPRRRRPSPRAASAPSRRTRRPDTTRRRCPSIDGTEAGRRRPRCSTSASIAVDDIGLRRRPSTRSSSPSPEPPPPPTGAAA